MRSALRIGLPEVVKRLDGRKNPARAAVAADAFLSLCALVNGKRNREMVKPYKLFEVSAGHPYHQPAGLCPKNPQLDLAALFQLGGFGAEYRVGCDVGSLYHGLPLPHESF